MNIRSVYRYLTHKIGGTLLHPQFFSHFFLKKCIKRRSPDIAGRLADLGCGQMPYRAYFNHTQYVSFDFPSTVVLDSHSKAPEVYGDLAHLPFADEVMDGVICIQVLEHVPDPVQVMLEINRVLRPGGLLLLSAPCMYPLHDEPYDFFRFTKYGLSHLIKRSGFEVVEIESQGGFVTLAGEFFNLYILHIINKLLKSNGVVKWLSYLLGAIFIPLAIFINIFCTILSPLDRGRRFVMNYFVYAYKKDNDE